jgi:hypothetical protein
MTPQQYLSALKGLGLTAASQRTARLLGINIRQSLRYSSGDSMVPATVEKILRFLKDNGTGEKKIRVGRGDKSVEAVLVDPATKWWDVMLPWGTQQFKGDAADLPAFVTARFKSRKEMFAAKERRRERAKAREKKARAKK